MNEKKLAYSKPDIEFVDFTLSSNIATGCTDVITSTDPITDCNTYVDDGAIMLFADISVCEQTPEDFYGPDVCYHNPDTASNVLFTS